MPVDTTRGMWEKLEDFYHDNINTSAANGVEWLTSTDGGGTAFAVDLTAATGGVATSVTAAAAELSEIGHEAFVVVPQHGFMYMEVRCQIDAITTVAVNIGFNDDALEDSNTLPVELSGTTFTSNAATFVGFVFDTDATNDDWHAFWVDDDNDTSTAIASLRYTGVAWKAAAYWTFRVELQDQGSGNPLRAVLSITNDSGTMFQKTVTTNLDRDASLTPYVAQEGRATVNRTLTVDYIAFGGSRE